MKILYFFAALPLLGAWWQARPLPTTSLGCQAQLVSRLEGEKLTLIGNCQNTSNQTQTLHYELLTDKKGQSGTSHNAQSGRFTVASQQTVTLSQTTINVAPADFYRVTLRVLDAHGSVLAEDSLVHQPGSRP